MKNRLLTLWKATTLLFVMAAFFGCSHQDTVLDAPAIGQERIALVYGDGPDYYSFTKGSLFTENGRFIFDDGDMISIWFDDNQYHNCEVKGGGVDKPAVSANRSKYAIYPSSAAPAAAEAYNGTTPNVIYPTTYSVSGKDIDSQMPLVAQNTEGNSKLVFHHVGGLLRIKLNGAHKDTRYVKVDFSKSELTGTFAVNVDDADNPYTEREAGSNPVGDGCSLTFSLPDSDADILTYVNVPLPVGEYEEETITVTLYDKNNNVLAADANNDSYQATFNLGLIERRSGRLCFMSLNGLSFGVDKVEVTSGDSKFSIYNGVGNLYLYEDPSAAQLFATVHYNNGAVVTDTYNSLVNWSSSDNTKVRVSATGRITAVGLTDDAGVTITATSVDDNTKSASITIKVSATSPEGNFTPMPFSVAADRTVEFSPGNLQATIKNAASPGGVNGADWQFAARQYEYIGAHENTDIYLEAGRVIDLFNWSGADNDKYRYGISVGSDYADAYDGWDSYNNKEKTKSICSSFYGTTPQEFIDWGNNTIGFRGNDNYADPYEYRTLTSAEWKYILQERTGRDKTGSIGTATDCRYSMVTVENVFGMMIYPDGFVWVPADMGPMPSRINVASVSSGSYSGAQWAALENAGVVFLPAAGNRGDVSSNAASTVISGAGIRGYYLSSTSDIDEKIYFGGTAQETGQGDYETILTETQRTLLCRNLISLNFGETMIKPQAAEEMASGSVRLVKGGKNVRRVELADKSIQLYANGNNSKTVSANIIYQNPEDTKPATLELKAIDYEKCNPLNLVASYPYDYGDGAPSISRLGARYAHTLSAFSLNPNTNIITASSYGYAWLRAYAPGSNHISHWCLVGATDGKIHLFDGKTVEFSPGNLQARLNNNGDPVEWRFAANETEFLGFTGWDYTFNFSYFSKDQYYHRLADKELLRARKDAWIDMFFRPASSNKRGVIPLYNDPEDLYYSNWASPLPDFVEYNIHITNNPYTDGYWKTPSYEEYNDICIMNRGKYFATETGCIGNNYTRNSGFYTMINGVLCCILIPDGYIAYIPKYNTTEGEMSLSEYTKLKNLGFAFMPHYTSENGGFVEANELEWVDEDGESNPTYYDYYWTFYKGNSSKGKFEYAYYMVKDIENIQTAYVRLIHVED